MSDVVAVVLAVALLALTAFFVGAEFRPHLRATHPVPDPKRHFAA